MFLKFILNFLILNFNYIYTYIGEKKLILFSLENSYHYLLNKFLIFLCQCSSSHLVNDYVIVVESKQS